MKYKINLLPEKERDLLDKGIYFVLHYLRYVLVITQIVVISVFFYRFKIDQEIIDLKDELQQKQEIVAVSDPLLKEAEIVDLKTKQIREILVSQALFAESFTYFLETFPLKLTIKRLDIQGGVYKFESSTSDPETIRGYITKLRQDKKFKQVTLGSIKRNGVEFLVPFTLSDFQLASAKK
jgi:Tfp pilus assembly protein PilN